MILSMEYHQKNELEIIYKKIFLIFQIYYQEKI
jgi:hypothetical protein